MLCLLSQAEAADRYTVSSGFHCTLSNGTRLVSVQDISMYFPDAVTKCSGTRAVASWRVPPGKAPRILRDPLYASDAEPEPEPQPSDEAPSRETEPEPLPPRRQRAELASAKTFDHLIFEASMRHGVDPNLIKAVIHVESAHQPLARSPKGALGLMQVMPATGMRYGASANQLLEPARNIDVGTRYLHDLQELFKGRTELILAAYNAGEGAVARYGNRIPPYRETMDYVRRALQIYRRSDRQP